MKFQLYRALLALLLGLFPQFFTSQNPAPPPPPLADSLLKAGDYAGALPLLQTALDSARQSSNWQVFNARAANIALCLYSLKKHDSACVFLEKSLGELSAAGQASTQEVGLLCNYLGLNHRLSERYAAALQAYQRGIAIFEKNGTLGRRPWYAYFNAAQILVRWENYTLANRYFEAALRADTSRAEHPGIYAQMANCAHYYGNEADVLKYYQTGMAFPDLSEEKIAHLQATGCTAFAAQSNFAEASRMLREALLFFKKTPREHDNVLRCLSALADYAERQGQLKVADGYFKQAIDLSTEEDGPKSRELAKLYSEYGNFLLRRGQRDLALNFFQQALVQAYTDFDSQALTDAPTHLNATPESYQAITAVCKAEALLAVEHPTQAERQQAAVCFQLAQQATAQLRRTYGSENDKILLASNNRHWQQLAARNLLALGGDPATLFAWCESTRAQALQDQLQRQRGLLLAGVPDSLLAREEYLRLNAADLRIKSDSASPEQRAASLRAEQEYRQFLEQLESRFPQFNALMAEDQAVKLADVCAGLPDTVALLEYFDAGDRYLLFTVRRSGAVLTEIPQSDSLRGVLGRWLKTLPDRDAQTRQPAAFLDDSYTLGQAFVPPGLLQAPVNTLWVIPDGQLSYVPFEALLTAPGNGSFGQAPWLVRSAAVCYGWSAGLLLSADTRQADTKGLLHCAPFHTYTRNGLAVLPGSADECPVATRSLTDEAATSGFFLENGPRYAVLHLATHAVAGDSSRAPLIEFADHSLGLSDLYARRFAGDLICLSACETGAGQYGVGEGLLSLARAFAYGGARSLVASAWAVSERSTSALFQAFYGALMQKQSRSAALRSAKLALLDGDDLDARKAPYYWAAFTLTGHDGPVELSSGRNYWWWLGAGVLLLAAFYWFRRRRGRN